MAIKIDPTKCIFMTGASFFESWQCTNRRKYGNYCGKHCPVKRAERKKKRGPSAADLERSARFKGYRIEKRSRELLDLLSDAYYSEDNNLGMITQNVVLDWTEFKEEENLS